jgi:nucleoid DNA-binding protein
LHQAAFSATPKAVSREYLVVTKKEIVKTIADEIGMTQLKTKDIVETTFRVLVDSLVQLQRIEIRNFGVFEVKRRAARKARNPRTNEKVFVPAKFVVVFKPGKEMEDRVRELDQKTAENDGQADAAGGPNDGQKNTMSKTLQPPTG